MKYSDKEREQFAFAQERSRNNDLPGTIEILSRLVAGKPRAAMFNATLANFLKAVGDITPAKTRFMANANSTDYRSIVADLNAKWFDEAWH